MKTVLITGGNRGLGKALVDCFAANGWKVLATARTPESLPATAQQKLQLDLSTMESIDSLVKSLVDDGNTTIDLLIHNAGFNPKDVKDDGYFESTFSIETFNATNVAQACFINALNPMELTSKLLPIMSDTAVVLAMSSWLGSMTNKNIPGHYGYSGSKALFNMMIKGLSMEFSKTSRAAVAINPGWVKTDMGGSNADVTPEQVANAILTMAQEDFFRQNNGKFLNTDRSEHPW